MQHTETGLSLLRVKASTKERFEQLRQEFGTTLTEDELLTRLLDEHDQQRKSLNTDQQPA